MRGLRNDGYFDDAALAAMIVAHDVTSGSLSDAAPAIRQGVGKQIIEAVRQGERDPNVLHQHALIALAIQEMANVPAA